MRHPRVPEIRLAFGRRLRAVRDSLGYTQKQMARALGIEPARYSKYEIGRSEAPYQVLVKIANLAQASLDYLITGNTTATRAADSWSPPAMGTFVEALPLATVVYDQGNRLHSCNRLFRRTFFPDSPHLVRPGTPREFLLRSWAYSQGHDPLETEDFVRARLESRAEPMRPIEVRLGKQVLRIAESRHVNLKVVLVTDLTSRS